MRTSRGVAQPVRGKRRPLTIAVTLSVGLATDPYNANTAEELMQRADEAFYRAAGEGRNQVVLAT